MPSSNARIGVLTPSSNTVLEPVTSAIVASLPNVSVHYARFRVVEISDSASSAAQFDLEPVLAAARLLADARVDAILWSGTSAGWLGIERDTALIEAIERETGIRAVTAVTAIDALLGGFHATRVALVTPYVAAVQSAIVTNWRARGIDVVAERHLGLSVNFAFAEVDETRVEALIDEVVRDASPLAPDAVVVLCTNLDGARAAVRAEERLALPVIDSTAAGAWGALHAAGVSTAALDGWGRLFALDA